MDSSSFYGLEADRYKLAPQSTKRRWLPGLQAQEPMARNIWNAVLALLKAADAAAAAADGGGGGTGGGGFGAGAAAAQQLGQQAGSVGMDVAPMLTAAQVRNSLFPPKTPVKTIIRQDRLWTNPRKTQPKTDDHSSSRRVICRSP